VLAEPIDCVREGLARRGLREAEFTDRFLRIEKHFVFGHSNAGERRFGRFSGELGNGFVHDGRGVGDGVGHLEFWRGNAGDFLKDIEGVLERPIAFGVAENVAFPRCRTRPRW
jgi:hypothetical protein